MNLSSSAPSVDTLGARPLDGDLDFTDDEAARIRRYVEGNLQNPSLLADLRKVSGRPYHDYYRRFRSTFGCAPRDLVMTQRLNRALLLIRGTGAGLSDVAAECGFSDHAHLSRTVRLFFGTTPTALRQAGLAGASLAVLSTEGMPGAAVQTRARGPHPVAVMKAGSGRRR